ncbi:Monocarboxylate transporter 13 [Clonorchis sinensis]|uniref:Monocarboxylate transporter 13 n=2 Tax=Clonorchis sinensis TaxID=79923 RepID=A0A8T1MVF6_CLOSI|nr:Monocarboxylate transporter 13 [Clonorchis sinensis]GAA51479.1 monocarboxylate transporter 2 [Clonorchis sinensis]
MKTVYVDSPQAWCTVIGGFVANFLLGGLGKSYGLIMDAFQEVYQSGSALFMLAGGLIYTLMFCLSLVNHYISQRYGSRPVVFAGAIGSCLSLLVAAFSPSIGLWVLAVGVGLGASLSCIYFTVFSVVGQCFRRYLGLANGISVAGVSVGQMAFPSLMTHLNEVYGTRGGAVIISALCLHLLITAALMPRYIVERNSSSEQVTKKQRDPARKRRLFRPRKSQRSVERVQLAEASLSNNSDFVNKKLGDTKLDQMYVELMDMEKPPPSQAAGDIPNQPAYPASETKTQSLKKTLSSMSLTTRFDAQLSRALLVVYILGKVFGDIGDVSISFVAPAHGTKLGFSPTIISRAIAISGAVDLVARLGVGWLTDRPSCVGRRGPLLATVWLVTGINSLGFSTLTRLFSADPSKEAPTGLLAAYYFCFAVHGVCSGTAMTQMIVVLSDWVGPSRLPHSLALTMVVLGLAISPGQFAIGYVADVTHDYVWSLRICFLIMMTAGILLLMEFPVRVYFNRKFKQLLTEAKLNGHSTSIVPLKMASFTDDPESHLSGQYWDVGVSDSEQDTDSILPRMQPALGSVPVQLSTADDGHSNGLLVCSQKSEPEE